MWESQTVTTSDFFGQLVVIFKKKKSPMKCDYQID